MDGLSLEITLDGD